MTATSGHNGSDIYRNQCRINDDHQYQQKYYENLNGSWYISDRKYYRLTLLGVIAEHVGKSQNLCLEEILSGMHAQQYGLAIAYYNYNDQIFKNKLLNALRDVDEAKFACFKPSLTIEGLISDLNLYQVSNQTAKSTPTIDIHPMSSTVEIADANITERMLCEFYINWMCARLRTTPMKSA